jgi:hypothetical protein
MLNKIQICRDVAEYCATFPEFYEINQIAGMIHFQKRFIRLLMFDSKHLFRG